MNKILVCERVDRSSEMDLFSIPELDPLRSAMDLLEKVGSSFAEKAFVFLSDTGTSEVFFPEFSAIAVLSILINSREENSYVYRVAVQPMTLKEQNIMISKRSMGNQYPIMDGKYFHLLQFEFKSNIFSSSNWFHFRANKFFKDRTNVLDLTAEFIRTNFPKRKCFGCRFFNSESVGVPLYLPCTVNPEQASTGRGCDEHQLEDNQVKHWIALSRFLDIDADIQVVNVGK